MKSSSVSKVICRSLSTSQPRGRLQSSLNTGFYNSEQVAMMDSVKRLVEEVINPNWQEWQTRGIFPAHQVFIIIIIIINIIIIDIIIITRCSRGSGRRGCWAYTGTESFYGK